MRRKLRSLILITSFTLATTAQATQMCSADEPMFSATIAKQLISQWNNSLIMGAKATDIKAGAKSVVESNYAQHAVLLPTLSNQNRVDNTQISQYFEHFLIKAPHLATGSPYNTAIYSSCGLGVANGDYDFNFKGQATAHARYTFVYEYISNPEGTQKPGWYITTHHSSVQPEAPKAKETFEF